ncbi:MAG: prephenate dehydrogenase/arogenate dehydrogenase family protein [Planctomycetaceae bacterium]|nr:prephenate dehydrogenase/arogenate dehydrogenase family protein [Planctomycetaceae bacterium]
MARKGIKHVTIVGVGLLGGSAAMALKAHDPSITVAGVGRRQASLDDALRVGAIDTAHLDLAEPARRTDLVILATPVGAFDGHLRTLKGSLRKGALVTDVGSTKAAVVRIAQRVLGKGGPFVGSHPMAGSEAKGVAFARGDLFHNATCIITPTPDTPPAAAGTIEQLWRDLGMRTVRMTPAAHDRAAARVSHLPHLLAGLLMMLPGDTDLNIAATGFRDATRLAGGDVEMWRDILLTNRSAILAAMETFEHDLMRLRDLIDLADAPGIEQFLAQAKTRRDQTIAKALADRRVAME